MPRLEIEYIDVHRAASWLEPRLAARFIRSVDRMRSKVSIFELGNLIAAGDVKGAAALLKREDVEEALAPVATVVRDAVLRGGKVGATNLNRSLKQGSKS